VIGNKLLRRNLRTQVAGMETFHGAKLLISSDCRRLRG
jgi:hypothetical protein